MSTRDETPIPFTVADRVMIEEINTKIDAFILAAAEGYKRCHDHHNDIESLKKSRNRLRGGIWTVIGGSIIAGVGALFKGIY